MRVSEEFTIKRVKRVFKEVEVAAVVATIPSIFSTCFSEEAVMEVLKFLWLPRRFPILRSRYSASHSSPNSCYAGTAIFWGYKEVQGRNT